MSVERKSLVQLFVPISFEILFYMLAGMVDTLMLSSVSDKAVGAVGTSNTYIGVFIIMFQIIASGMIAVMTQNIGAGRPGVAYQARQLALIFNTVLGVAMSIFLFTCSSNILQVVGIADDLRVPAETYLKIVGSGCILNALIPIFSSYLRAFGYAKQPLIASISANLINFSLNAFFLFVMHWGVAGVAYATVISRTTNLIIVATLGALLIKANNYPERIANKTLIRQIIMVGFPSAMENICYNLAMTFVIRFLNQMDPEGINVTARAYTAQITSFSFCVGAALAQANAIMTGWRMGAKEFAACKKGTRKAAILGVSVAIVIESLFTLAGPVLISFFTDDPVIISLVIKLLAIDIILECGRVTNLVYGSALKTSGDTLFPMIMGIIFMFSCQIGGTYLLGIQMGLMAVGAYIALASDEVFRAIGMVIRWKTGKWQTKRLIEI